MMPVLLPPPHDTTAAPWSRRIGVTVAVLALAGGVAGGWWHWRSSDTIAVPAVAVDTAWIEQSGSSPVDPPPAAAPNSTLAVTPGTAPAATPETGVVSRPVATPVEPAAPASTSRQFTPATSPSGFVPDDSLAILQGQLADLRARRAADSAAAEAKLIDDRHIRDSLDAAAQAATVEQEERDRLESQSRADQDAAANAATAERRHAIRLVTGKNALGGWLSSLVSSVNEGSVGAPVLTGGPPGFAAFVAKSHPMLIDARLLATSVNETTAEATAEWVARWQTSFGTTSSQRMKATVTLVPDRDRWHLKEWRITEGAP